MTHNLILTKDAAEKKLRRMAFEIVERNFDEKSLLLAGIRENGFALAEMLLQILSTVFKGELTITGITLDKKNPELIKLDNDIEHHQSVIIIDDVANSGKTMLYALKPFLNLHPRRIQTLVLVERTHKIFPINPDYKGLSIATTLQEHIKVEVENGVVAGAWLT